MARLIIGPLAGLLVTVVLAWLLPARWGHLRPLAAAGAGFAVALLLVNYVPG